MTDDTLLPFDLPAVSRKKVTADFAGGSISSDGGLVLLRGAERRLGLAETLAGCIREWRDPDRVVHSLPAMLRFRMFAIACGYEDADDCDDLRADPLFKLAVGRAPESGCRDLCSQPTMSRLENAPSSSEVGRMTAALVDIFCRSFPSPPAAITLDIDDTCDVVHGHQQLSLFNGFHDTRCCLPVHVYHVESGRPVAVLLRPGKTPSGVEVRTMLKHLTRRIRRHWPRIRLTFRGDSHYGRTEAMAWCEENGVDYIFGLAGNAVLHALAGEIGEEVRARHAEAGGDKVRGFADFCYVPGPDAKRGAVDRRGSLAPDPRRSAQEVPPRPRTGPSTLAAAPSAAPRGRSSPSTAGFRSIQSVEDEPDGWHRVSGARFRRSGSNPARPRESPSTRRCDQRLSARVRAAAPPSSRPRSPRSRRRAGHG